MINRQCFILQKTIGLKLTKGYVFPKGTGDDLRKMKYQKMEGDSPEGATDCHDTQHRCLFVVAPIRIPLLESSDYKLNISGMKEF